MRADDLLDALDPEQRQVADGAARPGPGAGRCRHRQDPGDHPPDRLRRRHRRLQPDRGARGHLHHPRRRRDAHPAARAGRRRRPGPHLPLRGAAAGALLLAQGLRRRAARADRVQDPDRRRRRPAQPGRGRPGAAARPGQRDRVGQGQQRPPRRLRARRAAARPRGQRARRRRRSPTSSPPTRSSSASRAGWTWRTCCSSAPPCSARTTGSPPRCAASTSGSSSTSSRTSARSSRRCSTSGSAAATRSAWSATRRRRSTPSPARRRRT